MTNLFLNCRAEIVFSFSRCENFHKMSALETDISLTEMMMNSNHRIVIKSLHLLLSEPLEASMI